MDAYKYVVLGGRKNPREGKLAIAFNVDLSLGSETVDVPKAGNTNLTQVRSIYIHNPDVAAAVTVTVERSSQVIKAAAGKIVYVPLFSPFPCRLVITSDVPTTSKTEIIVCNYDLEAFKPNG